MSQTLTPPVLHDVPADPPDAYVEAVVRRAGTSFFWAMRRLGPERRRGVFAVYAFCREVDDIADDFIPLDEKRRLLGEWRDELERIYQGHPKHPIARALIPAIESFGLKREDFQAVIDGMEMDAAPRVRIKDQAELDLYCDRVACAVGRLCVRVFGLPEKEGQHLAASLGRALQLTNILRDIAEDAGRDRVYLPADALCHAGADGQGLEDVLTAPGLGDLCDRLADEAELHFESAARIAANMDSQRVRPAVMMMEVYRKVLQNLRRRGWLELNRPVGPGKLEKLSIALRFGLFG